MILGRLLILAISLAASMSQCDKQKNVAIETIEFSSLTRGYQKKVTIRQDSTTTSVQGRGEDSMQKSITSRDEWDNLIKAIQSIDVNHISDLKSPSMKRAFDGAMHSSIRIVTKQGEVYEHAFDDENPHPALSQLLSVILKAE